MIQMQVILMLQTTQVQEESVYKVLGGSGRKTVAVGDIIVVSIKEAIPRSSKKGDVHRAVIVRTSKRKKRWYLY